MKPPIGSGSECFLEKGADDAECYRSLVNAQKEFIRQQKELIDWLTDNVKVHKSAEKIRYRFRYVFFPSIVVFLLLLVTVSLIVFRKRIFNKTIVFPPTSPDPHSNISSHALYSRTNWGPLDQNEVPPLIPTPTSVVIISHTDSDGCTDFASCANLTQKIQYAFLEDGHRDIGYNFLIGGEGGVYVGRGWDRLNSIRVNSVAIAFIGDFNKEIVGATVEDAAQALIDVGVKTGRISSDYKLIGENQTLLMSYSPGWNLAKAIQRWKNYFPDQVVTSDSSKTVQQVPKQLKHCLKDRPTQFWLTGLILGIMSISSLVVFLCLYSFGTSSPDAPTSGHNDNLGDDIQVIHREEWTSREPLKVSKVSGPLKKVRILHTAGSTCKDFQTCVGRVLGLQSWQVSTQGMPDIAYNYLIGGDGNVYVGRGAGVENQWEKDAIDIVYIGNFLAPYDEMTDKMDKAGRNLIERLSKQGYLTPDYIVIAHNQTYNTQSPGDNIYKRIVKWPHYDSGLYFRR